jgi:hypothetical protein
MMLSNLHDCQQGVDSMVNREGAYSALGLGAFTRRLQRYHLVNIRPYPPAMIRQGRQNIPHGFRERDNDHLSDNAHVQSPAEHLSLNTTSFAPLFSQYTA